MEKNSIEKGKKLNPTGRYWMCTVDEKDFKGIFMQDKVRYAVYQYEKSKSGFLHYQCYIECTEAVRFTWIKSTVLQSNTAHVMNRLGTRTQCREYCMKEESRLKAPVEIGDWLPDKGQGRRNDLNSGISISPESSICPIRLRIIKAEETEKKMSHYLGCIYIGTCPLCGCDNGSHYLGCIDAKPGFTLPDLRKAMKRDG